MNTKDHKAILRVWPHKQTDTLTVTVAEWMRLRQIEDAFRILVGAAPRELPERERQEQLHRGYTAVGPILWE